MHRIGRVFTLALFTLVAASAGLRAGYAAPATVTIDSTLRPRMLTVPTGTSVTWINRDDERHRMRSRGGPVEWDSNDLEPGGSFTFRFGVAGTYPYLDERDDENPAYHGTIVVETPSAGGGSGGGTGGGTGGGGTGGGAQAPASAAVRMVNRAFTPGTVTIARGGTVTWSNDDDDQHTVNATGGGFASGTMNPGARFSRRFSSAGTFQYFCAFHSDMRGTVRVQTPTGSVPPPRRPTSTQTSSGAAAGAARTAPPAGAPGQSGVAIIDFAFTPPTVRIRSGDAVVWANRGQAPHTVTAKDAAFDSGILEPGGTFRRIFAEEGAVEYACALHPNMTGTVLVGAATEEARAAQATPSGGGPTATPAEATGQVSAAEVPSAVRSPSLGTGTIVGMVLGIPGALLIGSVIYLRRTRAGG